MQLSAANLLASQQAVAPARPQAGASVAGFAQALKAQNPAAPAFEPLPLKAAAAPSPGPAPGFAAQAPLQGQAMRPGSQLDIKV